MGQHNKQNRTNQGFHSDLQIKIGTKRHHLTSLTKQNRRKWRKQRKKPSTPTSSFVEFETKSSVAMLCLGFGKRRGESVISWAQLSVKKRTSFLSISSLHSSQLIPVNPTQAHTQLSHVSCLSINDVNYKTYDHSHDSIICISYKTRI